MLGKKKKQVCSGNKKKKWSSIKSGSNARGKKVFVKKKKGKLNTQKNDGRVGRGESLSKTFGTDIAKKSSNSMGIGRGMTKGMEMWTRGVFYFGKGKVHAGKERKKVHEQRGWGKRPHHPVL